MNTYEIVTQKITDLMKENVNPWTRPWVTKSLGHQKNLSSLRPYRGLNALILALENKPNDYWLTFKQAEALGFQIRKGERSSMVIGWFKSTVKTKNEDDETTIESGLRSRYFRVFNLSSFDNVPQSLLDKTKRGECPTFEVETVEDAETKIKNSGAKIEFGVEQACYRPLTDVVSMPDRNRFSKVCEFYSTMFHELGHWTGHKSRLNRSELQKANLFNSKNYSQEELCAEMTSVFVCSSLNISNDSSLRNSAAYLKSWLKFIESNPKSFAIACQQAQKAADLLLNPTIADALDNAPDIAPEINDQSEIGEIHELGSLNV